MAQSFDLHKAPGHLARRAHQRTVAIFMEEAAAFDVTPVQFAILNALQGRPGEDQITLAGRVALDAATLGAVIARLQARGLVRRESDPGDRRRKLLWLTPQGQTLAEQLIAPARRVQERLMAPLSPEDRVLLVQLLERLVYTEGG
ncbi:MAG: MarR family transcriptional regulator [Burkholderiales bacterium RIFCSPHIGHO2_12_FULL_65_48]|nr:MAG: MarR family transcriptional regulator [Burkholderiales bacterium RIFCSPHIGHO2_12_FULL_65_48]